VYDALGLLREARFGRNDESNVKTLYSYDERGRLTRVASVDRDGAESESETDSYGQDGRRTKVYLVPKLEPKTWFSFGIEGTALSYGAEGATTITTRYDDVGQPFEVVFSGADERVLRRVIFTRDSTGRLMKEEMHLCESPAFPGIEKELENAQPEAREAAMAMFANLFGSRMVFSSTTYGYDEKGRLLERRTRMGELADERTTFRYDDMDKPVEETHEHTSREMRVDEEGNLAQAQETSHTQDTHFEYSYDAQGNWTERAVWSRLRPNPNFERSNVTRREIAYYAI
jgi:YD repeat-containing protein